jgi:hypothetical protein
MELLTLTIAGFQLTATQLILLSLPLLYVIYTIVIHLGYPKSNPLVWSWVPHLRSAARFGADPNSFLLQCKQQYGDVFTVNLGGKKMTFVTNPECFPHITKGRDGLSFGVVGQDVAVSVLDQDRDFAADMSLDEIIHGQYSKYLTGVNLDELTERYQENLGRWFQQHLEREASGVHKGTVKTGLLDFCTRAIFSASTRAIFGDLLVDSSEGNGQAATPQKWDSSFSDDFFAPKTLLGAFQAFDHAFPLLYGGLPHFLLKKGVQARSNLIDAFRYVKNGASEFVEVRKREMVRPQTG